MSEQIYSFAEFPLESGPGIPFVCLWDGLELVCLQLASEQLQGKLLPKNRCSFCGLTGRMCLEYHVDRKFARGEMAV